MSKYRSLDESVLTTYSDDARTIEINGRGRIRSLVFLKDGKYLLSGGEEATIRQWRIDDGVEVGEGMKAGSIVTAMDLSGDGKWIISGGERVANVWSTRSRQIVVTVSEHSDWVDTVHVSPDSTKFATGSNDKCAFIWNVLTGERLVGPLEHQDRVGAVRFSPDGDRIVTGTSSQGLRVYDAHNGELLRIIPVSIASYPTPIAWFRVQSIFALVCQKTLMGIDVNTGRTSSSWTIPGTRAYLSESITFGSVASSSNGRFIVSFLGSSVSLWDTLNSAQISSDIEHKANVQSIALSSDGRYLAMSDVNGGVTLRNLNDLVSNYYLVDPRGVVQQPRDWREDGHEAQIDALHSKLRALELRVGAFLTIPVRV